MAKKTELTASKQCIETLKIQILGCYFMVGVDSDIDIHNNAEYRILAFIRTLKDYLWSLPEDERNEYSKYLQPGYVTINEVVTISMRESGITRDRGIELNFNLLADPKESNLYVPEWKCRLIQLFRGMIEEKGCPILPATLCSISLARTVPRFFISNSHPTF